MGGRGETGLAIKRWLLRHEGVLLGDPPITRARVSPADRAA
jgi:hypothetical protein